MNFRTDPELLAALRHEAVQNGRSLTGEVEARLRKTIEGPSPAELAFGDSPPRDIVLRVIKLDQLVRFWSRGEWRGVQGVPYSFVAFQAGVDAIVAEYKPEGEVVAPEHLKNVDPVAVGQALGAATRADVPKDKKEDDQ
jgi:hypothetical protein